MEFGIYHKTLNILRYKLRGIKTLEDLRRTD